MRRKVYAEYIDSNGNSHQILKGVHPEQCEQYYKAKEEGDAIAMHYLGLPYWERPPYSIQSELKMIEMKCELDRKLEQIEHAFIDGKCEGSYTHSALSDEYFDKTFNQKQRR